MYKMFNLTEEQLKRIEKNRAAALVRKQQALQRRLALQKQENLQRQQALQMQQASTSKSTENYVEKKHCMYYPPKDNFKNKTATKTTAVFKLFGKNRFVLVMPYRGDCIDIFKSVRGRKFESHIRKWTFPLTEQRVLIRKLEHVPNLEINAIPSSVVKAILESDASESVQIDWNKIDPTLRSYLLPFQIEGIKFGIQKKGRCLIADEMGLGKTIQALGIAHYFKENWPLLIVCPTLMRLSWEEAIEKFLPSVKGNRVQVLLSGKGVLYEKDIVITSYDLMKTCIEALKIKRFGSIIFDESHLLKNFFSFRSKIALQLARTAKNVLLLSGTPALSRPLELYPQIQAIHPFAFQRFEEFVFRYCDAKKEKNSWNFSGSSNLEELEMFLKKKIMIRRLKSDVMKELPTKIRKAVFLHPSMLQTVSDQVEKLKIDYDKQKGTERHNALMLYYSITGKIKLNAVCEYIEQKLEEVNKFLVFAHHVNVIDGICDFLKRKNVNFIKIDGSVVAETRKIFCELFQNLESCRVAVLSLKAASFGITLTAAQLVIFAELYWNPGDLIQAEDRAHRIGQQENVHIEYLIAKGTADEHLWKLMDEKLNTLKEVGLSMENFKECNIELLTRPSQGKITQPKITAFLTTKEGNSKKDISNMPSCSTDWKMEMSKFIDDIIFNEAEDELLSKINLESIEEEYSMSNKKMKTAPNA